MTKIDELIKSICNKGTDYSPEWYSESDIEDIMIQYAEYYAKRCLQAAAENAKVIKVHGWESVKDIDDEFECGDYELRVYTKSITDITLPEHE